MTVTYTDNVTPTHSIEADSFVPRYARAKRARKGVKTWMILAPIGAVVLVGAGAVMMMNGGSESQPLVEPGPASPVVQPMNAQPLDSMPAPLESSVAVAPLTPAAAPVSVVREAASAPAPDAERRAVPVERRAVPATAPVVETPAEPTGPRPYTVAPQANGTTSARNSDTPAPVVRPAPDPTPPVPAIETAPLN